MGSVEIHPVIPGSPDVCDEQQTCTLSASGMQLVDAHYIASVQDGACQYCCGPGSARSFFRASAVLRSIY